VYQGTNGRRNVAVKGREVNKHKIEFSDTFTKTLPHQGKALYSFALAQYKAFKH
jgi:hypothetical protein